MSEEAKSGQQSAVSEQPAEVKAPRKPPQPKKPAVAAPAAVSIDPWPDKLRSAIRDAGDLLAKLRKMGADEEILTAVRKLEAAKHALERAAK